MLIYNENNSDVDYNIIDDYRTMSAKEYEEYMPFLLAKDGRKCNICKILIDELIEKAHSKEQHTGQKRKRPVVIIDHKNGNSHESHSIDSVTGKKVYAGNLQIACYSCNRKKNPHRLKITQSIGREPSREKLDRLRYEPTYHKNLHNFLIENEHGCLVAIWMAGKKLSEGGNEVTCKRYLSSERVTEVNTLGKYKFFAWKCDADHCNGTHVCLRVNPPISLIRQEKENLLKHYNSQYDNGDKYQYERTTYSFSKPFITFEEFYHNNSILKNQFLEIVDRDDFGGVKKDTPQRFQ